MKDSENRKHNPFTHPVVAVVVTSLIWFRIDGDSVSEMLKSTFIFFILFLFVFACSSDLSN